MRLEFGSRYTLFGTLYDHVLVVLTDWGESLPPCLADLRILGRPVFRVEPETWGQRAWVAHGGWCDVQGYERARGVLVQAGYEVGESVAVEGKVGKSSVKTVGCRVGGGKLTEALGGTNDGSLGTNDGSLGTACEIDFSFLC